MASGGKTFTLKYQQGDLFDCPKTDSLAHCVSRDLKMGKGVAVGFKKKFGQVDYLKGQGKKVGEVAYLDNDGRFIYYLITKEKATDKPTYDDFKKSLQYLKKHCVFAKVAHLSMPRIGCGLDRLEWSKVEQIISDTFGDMNIAITVYDLPPKESDVKQSEKSYHSRDEKASPKGDEMISFKDVKALKTDEKSPQTEDEKTSIRKDEKPFLKRDEQVPSKEDEKSTFKKNEKAPSKVDEKPSSKRDENTLFKGDEKLSAKRDENAPSKGADKNTFKRDENAPSKRDENTLSRDQNPSPTKELKKSIQ